MVGARSGTTTRCGRENPIWDNSFQQFPTADWCPTFASRTTQDGPDGGMDQGGRTAAQVAASEAKGKGKGGGSMPPPPAAVVQPFAAGPVPMVEDEDDSIYQVPRLTYHRRSQRLHHP